MTRYLWFGFIFLLATIPVCAQPPASKPPEPHFPPLKQYDTKYYTIYTDIDPADEREAAIRMTKMAEEYRARTSEFSGVFTQKLPFYLFKESSDYYAAGGLPASQGVFTGKQLMAIAGDHPGYGTWHVVQHEGFHQFAGAAIGGQMPAWLNEGLADYFGEAVFTGDGFVSGAIPSARLRRLKAEMDLPGFRTIRQLMDLTHEQWNQEMSLVNYDQAWSLVYFLAHADDGKFQKTFNAYMQQLSKGADPQAAWHATFVDTLGLENHWREYWKDEPAHPSDVLFAKATVMTLTGFLARSSEMKQKFDTFEDFEKTIEAGHLKIPDSDWLPPSLIESAEAVAKRREELGTKYYLESGPPKVICELSDGTKIRGTFWMKGGVVSEVKAEVIDPPTTKKSMK